MTRKGVKKQTGEICTSNEDDIAYTFLVIQEISVKLKSLKDACCCSIT